MIKRRDIIALVDTIKAARGPGAAVTTQAWVRRVFSWAVEKAEIEVSPAAGLRRPAPARVRDRALSDDELRRLWLACDERPHPFGNYLKMLLLTGCRRNEIATLRWEDVDLADRTITIPADRYKTGRAHQVPLSRQAAALLEALPRFTGPYVFSATGGEKALCGFNWFKDKIDGLLSPAIDYDLHDLRRTCRTGMSRLRVPPHIAERCLGHAQRGIEKHYDMHGYADEKRAALQQWADHITRLVDGEAAGNVVALRG